MKGKLLVIGAFCCSLFIGLGSPLFASELDELKRQIDILSDEMDSLKLGSSGSKLADRIKIHGYGEMHLNHKPGDQGRTEIDNHRFVIGVHALLTDWIHLNAEIDFEHAAQKMEFEFGYLDFLLNERYNARAGVMLIPVGFLNEFHEPPLFWTVERPQFHNKIVPTSWAGAGAGLFGTLAEGLNYRLYVVNSVQSLRITEDDNGDGGGGAQGQFKGSSGIRSGRLQIDHAIAEDWAITGRLEYSKLFPGLQLGFSFYTGDTTHGFIDEGGHTTLLEADVRYRWKWFEMNSSVANIDVSDAAEINAFCSLGANDCSPDVAENIFGWNVQAGVHLLQLMGKSTTQDLIPYVLYEHIRPQDKTPTGTPTDHANNFELITAGLSYMPIESVALKTNWQHFMHDDSTSKDQINVGVAYMY